VDFIVKRRREKNDRDKNSACREQTRVRHIGVASDTSLNAVVRASVGEGFMAILKADQEREFPLIFRRGELLEKNCKEISPFVMIVSWRRNSSFWLPQFPKIILSSARTMRTLKSAK
jgi:hypothetical protein